MFERQPDLDLDNLGGRLSESVRYVFTEMCEKTTLRIVFKGILPTSSGDAFWRMFAGSGLLRHTMFYMYVTEGRLRSRGSCFTLSYEAYSQS